jgi:hypothetical protein
MKHAREDYNRIQDPAGLIPEDEPVFLMRAPDLAAPFAVMAWVQEAMRFGAADAILRAAFEQALAMRRSQARGYPHAKIPDMPA